RCQTLAQSDGRIGVETDPGRGPENCQQLIEMCFEHGHTRPRSNEGCDATGRVRGLVIGGAKSVPALPRLGPPDRGRLAPARKTRLGPTAYSFSANRGAVTASCLARAPHPCSQILA